MSVSKDFDGPARTCAVIAPNDSTDLTETTRAISIGAAGSVKITTVEGDVVVIPSGILAVGVQHSIQAKRVWSTSTTATPIVGWW